MPITRKILSTTPADMFLSMTVPTLRTTAMRLPRATAGLVRPVRMYHEKVLDHYNNPRNVSARVPGYC